ncbi:MAG: nucleotidyl transferase AbiEii/AbiGii toxin family protein [Patescibacteria group bacterium]|jgi:predicted nucleotidyltransferase component of viral defense system|nr:nucleotidyl transferase AbiEii/AbiGii toxin family protein [Patescibacteria group bacterium]
MILSNKKDAIHRAWLYRVLISIVDNPNFNDLYFKEGTCAAMLGFLDRFSVDLDFDFVGRTEDILKIKNELKSVFKDLGLEIKDESEIVPQFFLRYPTKDPGERNTLKIDITFPAPKNNIYEMQKLIDVDRIVMCQNIETMFANKLVSLMDRYEKNGSIAGRDLYDIHHFFLNGFNHNEEVIKERTDLELKAFFLKLEKFIKEKITDKIISQDLNMLVDYEKFKTIRKTLKIETLMFIRNEIEKY